MLQLFKKRLSNRKGFTLVELLVVIAIIGILAAIAVPKFSGASEAAKGTKVLADLRTIDSASQLYYAQKGVYPTSTAVLVTANLLASEPTVITAGEKFKVKDQEYTAAGTAYAIDETTGRATYISKKAEEFGVAATTTP